MKRKNLLFYMVFALIFIFAGVIIATNLNLPILSKAEESSLLPLSKSKLGTNAESPFVAVAEKVSPAVVNISAEKVVVERYSDSFPFGDEFFRRFFGESPYGKKAPVQKRKNYSLGSGFIFNSEGYILTNNHVVAGADNITVTLADGSDYQAKLAGADKESDLAVLKINTGKKLPTVIFGNSDALKVGEWVMAIGNPFPQLHLDRTVTVGVVSAKGRSRLQFGDDTPQYQNYIQTDAAINPGNSGGPLVNIQGEVVGVNAAITNPTGMNFNIGIGFAIPINLANAVIPSLVKSGKVSRGFLGVQLQDIDKIEAEARGLSTTEGALISGVQAGTPAEKAGIKTGDIIVEFDGKKVIDSQSLNLLVAEVAPNKEIELKVDRGGKPLTFDLRLADKSKFVSEPSPEKESGVEEQNGNWLGLDVRTLSRDLAEQFNIPFVTGVLVVNVEGGSLAQERGFDIGDIIMEINGQKIVDLSTYKQILNTLKQRKKAISFLVNRNGNTFFIAVKPE
jgi:serine protease Do